MSKRWILFPIALTLACGAAAACSSNSGSEGDGDGGAPAGAGKSSTGPDSAGESAGGSGQNGEAGASTDAGTGPGSDGTAGAGGVAGEQGSGGAAGDNGSPTGAALPLDAFLYVRALDADRDELVARSFTTGEEYTVTDLTEDGSEGWEIWGHTLSPDRKTIVLASLFGPTKEDNDTQLATRRLWSLGIDGTGFKRLTPVFDNTGQGRKNFEITVQSPMFSADGSAVIFDFGNWWYEGTTLEGGSRPWFVSAAGGLPDLFPSAATCTVVDPSVNPATGDILFVHSVCTSSQDEGLFLYPADGSGPPVKLLQAGFGTNQVDPSLVKASWLGDGSGFVFVGGIEVTRNNTTERASSLLLYELESGDITPIVVPDAGNYVRSGTISADGSSIVYCLDHGSGEDLIGIDLTQDPAVVAPITSDGVSCDAAF